MVISLPEQQAYVYRNGVLIEAVLQSELHGQASASRSQPYYLDVTRPEANKGSVVEFLSKRLYIAPANFVTLSNQEDGFAYAMDKFVLPTATSVSAP
jgi:hydroxymethylpyrimidine pyrophosphatase-like HAD family hydrolase